MQWYSGRLPSFHGAEILEVVLDRVGAACRIRIHTFETTDNLDQPGYLSSANHAIISFDLAEITDLELNGFNHQNVIDGLRIGRAQKKGWRIDLEHCWGISGFIEAHCLKIAVQPGKPSRPVAPM